MSAAVREPAAARARGASPVRAAALLAAIFALLAGLAKVDHVAQAGGNPDRAGENLLHGLLAGFLDALALLVLGWFLRTWWQRGRDARIPTIDDSVLLPSPPPQLTPALAAVL